MRCGLNVAGHMTLMTRLKAPDLALIGSAKAAENRVFLYLLKYRDTVSVTVAHVLPYDHQTTKASKMPLIIYDFITILFRR